MCLSYICLQLYLCVYESHLPLKTQFIFSFIVIRAILVPVPMILWIPRNPEQDEAITNDE